MRVRGKHQPAIGGGRERFPVASRNGEPTLGIQT
jgi:hypothetical protein